MAGKTSADGKSGGGVWRYVVAVSAFLISFAGMMLALNNYCNDAYMEERKDLYAFAKTYTDAIGEEMKEPAKEAVTIVGKVRMNPNMMTWFERQCAETMEKDSSVIGIELIQEGANASVRSYPQGFSLKKEPGLAAAYEHVSEETGDTEGRPKTVGPVEMADGSMSVLTIAPIYTYNNHTMGFDKWGTVSVVSSLPDVIADSLLSSLPGRGYAYALYGNNDLLEDGGIVSSSQEPIDENAESSVAAVSQGLWLLKVSPLAGLNRIISTEVAVAVSLVVGGIIGMGTLRLTR